MNRVVFLVVLWLINKVLTFVFRGSMPSMPVPIIPQQGGPHGMGRGGV